MEKDIEFVAFEKRCINFDGEFPCPRCGAMLYPVCVNLGMIRDKFYCSAQYFDRDCGERGCPKYMYVDWRELTHYRRTGKLGKGS
jgi:hypothetical protein